MFQQGDFSIAADATPDQIARRRAALQAALQRGRTASSAGEGLINLLSGALAPMKERRLDKIEGQQRAKANDVFSQALGGFSILGPSSMPQASPPPPVTSQPIDSPEAVADDTMMALGKQPMRPFRNAIASIESAGSGDYAAVGPTHPKLGRALGRYQVMEANIGPWSREVLGREVTPQEFMANPQLQDAIFDGKFGQYVQKFGPDGAAQAWFGGEGGVGRLDRKDSLGTSIGDYTQKFQSAMGGGSGAARSINNFQGIAEAMSNPWVMEDPGKAAILNAMIGRHLAPPAQQYRTMRGADLGLSGPEADKIFNVSPDGKISAIGGGGVTINTGDQGPSIGSVPQGYSVVADPTDPSGYRMLPIPGGPEDTSSADAARMGAQQVASETVTTAAQRARQAAGNRNLGAFGTSIVGAINPYSDSAEVMRQTSAIKSIASAEALNAMRRQSPTGGALGNVTEKELKLLSEQGGALDPNSPNFLRDLADYERALLRTIHGPEEGDRIFAETRQEDDGWQTVNGVRVRVKK